MIINYSYGRRCSVYFCPKMMMMDCNGFSILNPTESSNEAPSDVIILLDGSTYLRWKMPCFAEQKILLMEPVAPSAADGDSLGMQHFLSKLGF